MAVVVPTVATVLAAAVAGPGDDEGAVGFQSSSSSIGSAVVRVAAVTDVVANVVSLFRPAGVDPLVWAAAVAVLVSVMIVPGVDCGTGVVMTLVPRVISAVLIVAALTNMP